MATEADDATEYIRLKRMRLASVLEVAGITTDQHRAFRRGYLAPTRAEWMALHRALRVPPECILDLAVDDCPESEYKEA
jgi:hypothetical protein